MVVSTCGVGDRLGEVRLRRFKQRYRFSHPALAQLCGSELCVAHEERCSRTLRSKQQRR